MGQSGRLGEKKEKVGVLAEKSLLVKDGERESQRKGNYLKKKVNKTEGKEEGRRTGPSNSIETLMELIIISSEHCSVDRIIFNDHSPYISLNVHDHDDGNDEESIPTIFSLYLCST